MTDQEFQTAISPILLKWPRGYSGDQVHLVKEEVKMLSHPDFVRLVRHLLGSMRVAPMVPDFKKGIQELGISFRRESYSNAATPQIIQSENFLYQIRDNIWADDNYILIRGEKPSFIVKADHPNHPYVLEDAEVRSQKLKQTKEHLHKRTYEKFMESLGNKGAGLRLAFSKEGA
jgi:hypothetical protein